MSTDTTAATDTREATEMSRLDGAVLGPEVAGSLKQRWSDIKVHFVDDPEDAVRDADALVEEVIDEIQQRLHAERARLSGTVDGEEQSTEDLRVLTQAYRDLFGRLLEMSV